MQRAAKIKRKKKRNKRAQHIKTIATSEMNALNETIRVSEPGMSSHFITINKNVPNFHCHRFVYLLLNKTFMAFCLEISKRFLCVCVVCVYSCA